MRKVTVRPGRKRFIRRSAALVAALMGAALAITGCSSNGASSGSGSGAKEITVWHYLSDPGQAKYITEPAARFKKSHPDVKVNIVYVPIDQLQQKLINSAGAKTGPDVVLFNIGNTPTLAAAGALAPLDAYWDKFADKAKFAPASLSYYNKKIYAVGGVSDILALWYNKTLMTKLGISAPPTTVAELTADMAKATAAGLEGITLSGAPTDQGEYQEYPWLTEAGFSYEHPKEASLEKAYTTVQSWVKSGALSKEAVNWNQVVPFSEWAKGDVLFAENGNWNVEAASTDAKFSYGVAPLPIEPDGKAYASGTHPAIGAFSKDKSLAWDYIDEAYLTPDAQIEALTTEGGVPANSDVRNGKEVSGNPILAGFASTLAKFGADYPSTAIPSKNVAAVQTLMGQMWSEVIGMQLSPADAAAQTMNKLTPLLSK